MDCETLARLAMTRVDPALQPEVDRHLADCPACRAHWEAQQRLAQSLADLRADVAPFAAPIEVEANLRSAFAQRTQHPGRWERLNLFGLPIAIAAVLAMVTWSLRAPLPTIDPSKTSTVAATPASS